MVDQVERIEERTPGPAYLVHRPVKGVPIRSRRLPEPTDFPHELQRRVMQLGVGGRMIRMAEAFDVSAHVEGGVGGE